MAAHPSSTLHSITMSPHPHTHHHPLFPLPPSSPRHGSPLPSSSNFAHNRFSGALDPSLSTLTYLYDLCVALTYLYDLCVALTYLYDLCVALTLPHLRPPALPTCHLRIALPCPPPQAPLYGIASPITAHTLHVPPPPCPCALSPPETYQATFSRGPFQPSFHASPTSLCCGVKMFIFTLLAAPLFHSCLSPRLYTSPSLHSSPPHLSLPTFHSPPPHSTPLPAPVAALLTYSDLSSNQFTGTVPPAVSNPTGLVSINLAHNLLQGSIPRALSRLSSLTYLCALLSLACHCCFSSCHVMLHVMPCHAPRHAMQFYSILCTGMPACIPYGMPCAKYHYLITFSPYSTP
ncbi:unnamed protein product [Closterium sp. NIES-53]